MKDTELPVKEDPPKTYAEYKQRKREAIARIFRVFVNGYTDRAKRNKGIPVYQKLDMRKIKEKV